MIESASNCKCLFIGRQDGLIDKCELGTSETVEKLRLYDSFAKIHYLE